jgi:hypothetical protein
MVAYRYTSPYADNICALARSLLNAVKYISCDMRPITAEEEFCKNTELKREDLEHIRQWMSAQPHLPRGVPGNQ